ncbi:hypothetical protein [Cupriavidus sp. L7L]|uniref:hypothetical protein n=1 Tax=Cupriavidus sp. L7L TaxID=2546443 RepID=UPI0010567F41|nr:hypothetical protein [Cupriavidus sp. L7L]TDF62533.1 hypothetical protein E1J61_28825 [Cupriavidus sp. L7L]
MKTILLTMAGAMAAALSLAAMAGPDWSVIEKARGAKQAQAQKATPHQPMTMEDHAAMIKACREMMAQPK